MACSVRSGESSRGRVRAWPPASADARRSGGARPSARIFVRARAERRSSAATCDLAPQRKRGRPHYPARAVRLRGGDLRRDRHNTVRVNGTGARWAKSAGTAPRKRRAAVDHPISASTLPIISTARRLLGARFLRRDRHPRCVPITVSPAAQRSRFPQAGNAPAPNSLKAAAFRPDRIAFSAKIPIMPPRSSQIEGESTAFLSTSDINAARRRFLVQSPARRDRLMAAGGVSGLDRGRRAVQFDRRDPVHGTLYVKPIPGCRERQPATLSVGRAA